MSNNLSPHNVDLIIAAIKGWIIRDTGKGYCVFLPPSFRAVGELPIEIDFEADNFGFLSDKIFPVGKMPKWSTKMGDAWKLVEEVIGERYSEGFTLEHFSFPDDEIWTASFYPTSEMAETAPMAICKAWISLEKRFREINKYRNP